MRRCMSSVRAASASASAALLSLPRSKLCRMLLCLQVRSAVAHTAAAAGAGIVELNLELTDLQV
jgi:hypothetical protein